MEIEQMRRQLRKTDPHEILGVKSTDDENTIKQSFKRMALKYHPDKNSMPGAKEAFSNITNAYQVLSKNRSYSLPKKQFTSKSTYTKQYSYQKSNFDHYKQPEQARKQPNPSFNYQPGFNQEQKRQFEEQMFDIFKNITTKLHQQAQKKKQAREQENYYKRRASVFANNNNRKYPHPLLTLLLFVFLTMFFMKMNGGGRFRSRMSTSFMHRGIGGIGGMGSMSRMGGLMGGRRYTMSPRMNQMNANNEIVEELQSNTMQQQPAGPPSNVTKPEKDKTSKVPKNKQSKAKSKTKGKTNKN